MKKVIAIALAALLCLGLFAACGEKKDPTGGTEPTGGEPTTTMTAAEILEKVKEAYGENLGVTEALPTEMLENQLGLKADMYADVASLMAMISVNNDCIVVVKAAEGQDALVKAALEDALQKKKDDTLQYPMNVPKTNAGTIVRQGDWFMFIITGAQPEDLDMSEADRIAHFEAEVEKGVAAFNACFS